MKKTVVNFVLFILVVYLFSLVIAGQDAILLTIALMLTIVLHEFGHAYFAQKHGYRFKIRFNPLLLVAVTEIKDALGFIGSLTTDQKILFTLGGPLVNLILIIFGFLAFKLIPATASFDLWLLYANLLLLTANMLPIFIVDGGQASRFILTGLGDLPTFIFIIFNTALGTGAIIGAFSIFLGPIPAIWVIVTAVILLLNHIPLIRFRSLYPGTQVSLKYIGLYLLACIFNIVLIAIAFAPSLIALL